MDEIAVTTLMVGGPRDGKPITVPQSMMGNKLHVEAAEPAVGMFLPDDSVLAGDVGECERTLYNPVRIMFGWPGGVVWIYHVWVHESIDKLSLDSFHPGSCYVERRRIKPKNRDSYDFFHGGAYRPSMN
jgi:hypothetical protein